MFHFQPAYLRILLSVPFGMSSPVFPDTVTRIPGFIGRMDKLTMIALLPGKNPSFFLKPLQNLANFHRPMLSFFPRRVHQLRKLSRVKPQKIQPRIARMKRIKRFAHETPASANPAFAAPKAFGAPAGRRRITLNKDPEQP